jgi:hypothetical protein
MEKGAFTKSEKRATGSVPFKVYKDYFSAGILFLLFFYN